ncbi:ATP-binding protein [Streptomyces sp. NPDC052023]|uniref:ATP-binding protein n=1 Tax=Streptomyces sp. NPDC052023 TaxID=3365681 RepID=UPI0037D8D364
MGARMPMDGTRELMGRQRETALLGRALDEARNGPGRGSATHLRGEAGIGKTALLEWTAAQARERGFSVLRAVGSEAEAELAFGALHQVFRPLMGYAELLAPCQREALESALGLCEGRALGGLVVGAAALSLLLEATRRRPLLILVDDLHWVDSSSAAVFTFLHRRISELPLVIVSAGRPDGTAPDGTSSDGRPARPVTLEALAPDDAARLLRRRHPELGTPAVRRIVREAAGNPLALVELPLQLSPEQWNGDLPDRVPLGRRLERLFAHRLDALAPEAIRVLLLVALGGGPAAWSAGKWLRVHAGERAVEVLDEIEAGGLARLDSSGRLAFRHPLVGSAVVSRATSADKREAHRELAEALPADDPRRLVHEAAASLFPDEELAARLDAAGRRLSRRGGDSEAALLLDRAAVLSTDPGSRARRLTWAAVMAARGGRLPYTARIVAELRRSPVPDDIAPLFAYAAVYVDQSHRIDFASSFTLLPEALDALAEPGAQSFAGLAEQVYFKLLLASAYTNDPRGWRALERHRHRVSPLARLCHRVWSDPARTAHGAVEELRSLASALSEEQEAGAAWLLLWTAAAVDAADSTLWRRFTGQHAYATQGTIAKARSYQDYLHGRWDQAEACLREAQAAEDLGYHCNALLFRHHYAHFLAGRGDEEGLLQAERSIRPLAARARMKFVEDHLTHLRALAALGHGRYEEAYVRLAELTPPGVLPQGLPWFHLPFFDFVSAATHTGRHEAARAHLAAARAARMADISPHHAFLLAAASALAAGDDEADGRYEAAYAVPGAGQWVFEGARLRLAHGVRLRRQQRAGARDALGEARRTFVALGAVPWARQAERELRAAGQAAGEPHGGRELLTAHELRVAQLAADGLTNKDIGQRLRVSPRTVADHLYRIYPKLGITSRAALARALGGE